MTYWETRHEPIVYYMAHKKFKGAVKIGTTVNQKTRIARFCKNRHDDNFYILAKEPGDGRLESKRHFQFAQYKVAGDWFFLTEELLDHVREVQALGFEPELIGSPDER